MGRILKINGDKFRMTVSSSAYSSPFDDNTTRVVVQCDEGILPLP